jgi:hypothetical protein
VHVGEAERNELAGTKARADRELDDRVERLRRRGDDGVLLLGGRKGPRLLGALLDLEPDVGARVLLEDASSSPDA